MPKKWFGRPIESHPFNLSLMTESLIFGRSPVGPAHYSSRIKLKIKDQLEVNGLVLNLPLLLRHFRIDDNATEREGFCMNRFLHGAASAVLFTLGLGGTAFATASLELVSGTDIIYLADGGTLMCTAGGVAVTCATFHATFTNPQPGDLIISAGGGVDAFNGWDVTISSGGSNSPGCPAAGPNGVGCMDTANINANSSGGGKLGAYFADTGFNPAGATGLMVANASVLQTGDKESQTAYANAGVVNPLSSVNLNPVPAGGQCGSVLSSLPPGVTALPTNCSAPSAPFSLELATVFDNTITGAAGAFDVNGNISATIPEPVSVALFGTVLVLCASGLRRRRRLSQKG